MIAIPPEIVLQSVTLPWIEHRSYRRCEGSFLALGDLLPFGNNREYVKEIYVIRDRNNEATGWAYKSQNGRWWLQAGSRMDLKDVLHVGAHLPIDVRTRRGSVSPMSRPRWTGLKLVDECE
jgi:hypothetical protein